MKCFECGSNRACHKHHVVPKSRGGKRTVDLCETCHAKAHHTKKNMAISGLVKSAFERKRKNGERIGAVPFGFSLSEDGVKLIANANEQHVLDMIRQWRCDGKSLREIAAELTRQGIPTKSGKAKWHLTAAARIVAAKPWSTSTIQRILGRSKD